MTGTPRKTTKKPEAGGDVVDLTSLLAPAPLDPVTVTLLDETYTVRRDLTGAEVGSFWAQLLGEGERAGIKAYAVILGSEEAAERMEKQLSNLPPQAGIVLSHKLFKVAGLVERDGEPGESPAS